MSKRISIPKARMKQYLKELNSQVGIGRIGGSTLRKKVIEKVAGKLKDQTPPSPSTLANWQMRHTSIQRK